MPRKIGASEKQKKKILRVAKLISDLIEQMDLDAISVLSVLAISQMMLEKKIGFKVSVSGGIVERLRR